MIATREWLLHIFIKPCFQVGLMNKILQYAHIYIAFWLDAQFQWLPFIWQKRKNVFGAPFQTSRLSDFFVYKPNFSIIVQNKNSKLSALFARHNPSNQHCLDSNTSLDATTRFVVKAKGGKARLQECVLHLYFSLTSAVLQVYFTVLQLDFTFCFWVNVVSLFSPLVKAR